MKNASVPRKFVSLFVALVVVALGFARVDADVIQLVDGSVIQGQVKSMADGKLTVTTSFAPELVIAADQVKSIVTTEPRTVKLPSGEQLVGQLEVVNGQQVVKSEAAGPTNVEAAKIQGVWAPGEEDPAAVAAREALKAKWTSRLLLGMNGATGNNERFNFMGRGEVRRTTSSDRLLLFIQGKYAQENGDRSENEILGGATLEVDISDKWYWFLKGQLEYDEFENLDLRATATGGVGYFWIREADQELKTRVGVGYQHESFADNTSSDEAILELGLDYRKEIAPWLLFTHSTTYYPTLSDFGDYRLALDTAGEIPLSSDKKWKLRVGMANDYDARPQPGIERLDTTYYLNMVWDFD